MTKIAELKDKGAVVAWSPLGEYADVIALGSKVCMLFVYCIFAWYSLVGLFLCKEIFFLGGRCKLLLSIATIGIDIECWL